MPERYDVIVVGLGAMGAATLYQLAKRGRRVLGIDRYDPPHDRGSSHGRSRITRLAVGEGEAYVPLAMRSHALWREIESATGERLLEQIGLLVLGSETHRAPMHGREHFVRETIRLAERFGIAHEMLHAADMAARYPQLALRGDEVGYYEPGAGYLRPERCIAAQLALAREFGAQVRMNEPVLAIETGDGSDGVRVRTSTGTLLAGEAVLAAGAWIQAFLPDAWRPLVGVYRQVLCWFDVGSAHAQYAPERFPAFIWVHGEGQGEFVYGFPALDGPHGGVKIGTEQFVRADSAEHVDRAVDDRESERIHAHHVEGRLRGVGPRCLAAMTCLYTNTPDRGFIVDRHPDLPRMTIVSACSGHGFKHSAALGEAIAQRLCEGGSEIDLAPFAAVRFG